MRNLPALSGTCLGQIPKKGGVSCNSGCDMQLYESVFNNCCDIINFGYLLSDELMGDG